MKQLWSTGSNACMQTAAEFPVRRELSSILSVLLLGACRWWVAGGGAARALSKQGLFSLLAISLSAFAGVDSGAVFELWWHQKTAMTVF